MTITATELKKNFSKYLFLSTREQIVVLRYGKPYTVLGEKKAKKLSIEDLFGSLPSNLNVEETLASRAI